MKIFIKLVVYLLLSHSISSILCMRKDDITLANPVKSNNNLDLKPIEVSSSLVGQSKILETLRHNENLPSNSTLYLTKEDLRALGFNYKWKKIESYFKSFEEILDYRQKLLDNKLQTKALQFVNPIREDLTINRNPLSFSLNCLAVSDKLGLVSIYNFLLKRIIVRLENRFSNGINLMQRDVDTVDNLPLSIQSILVDSIRPCYEKQLQEFIHFNTFDLRNKHSADRILTCELGDCLKVDIQTMDYWTEKYYTLNIYNHRKSKLLISQQLSEDSLYSIYYRCGSTCYDSYSYLLALWDPSQGSEIKIVDLVTNSLVVTLPSCDAASLSSVVFNRSEKLLAYSNDEYKIIIVDFSKLESPSFLELPALSAMLTKAKSNFKFSHDSSLLAVNMQDKIVIWNVSKDEQEGIISKTLPSELNLKDIIAQLMIFYKFNEKKYT